MTLNAYCWKDSIPMPLVQMPNWQPGFSLSVLNWNDIYSEEMYMSSQLPKHSSKKNIFFKVCNCQVQSNYIFTHINIIISGNIYKFPI
jgi:hypothetical protein